jgi:hypothetical protein
LTLYATTRIFFFLLSSSFFHSDLQSLLFPSFFDKDYGQVRHWHQEFWTCSRVSGN